MSQKYVETVLGRLATDESLRRRFQEDREATLDELVAQGAQLTPVERRVLLDLDFTACEQFAERLDPRIQKACFRKGS